LFIEVVQGEKLFGTVVCTFVHFILTGNGSAPKPWAIRVGSTTQPMQTRHRRDVVIQWMGNRCIFLKNLWRGIFLNTYIFEIPSVPKILMVLSHPSLQQMNILAGCN
jgi:hypothetical protein